MAVRVGVNRGWVYVNTNKLVLNERMVANSLLCCTYGV